MSPKNSIKRRVLLYGLLTIVAAGAAGVLVAIESSDRVYTSAETEPASTATPFPVGVDPVTATITEQPSTEEFYAQYLAQTDTQSHSWWTKLASVLQTNQIYQNLASSVSRIVVIWPGERTEEAASNIGDVLRWSNEQRAEFASLIKVNNLNFSQGFAVPGQYVTHRHATPEDIAAELQAEFQDSVQDRYTDEVESVVSLADALVIASLIEREASDFENMREISGVIWNRLFIDMPLQLDASLQYVKAENQYETNWWPVVRPADKFIDSPFNTYQNKGLPPEPIANPSVEAIVAALNPRETECFYYFHSSTREYYCSETYEEHVTKLRQVYGQGS